MPPTPSTATPTLRREHSAPLRQYILLILLIALLAILMLYPLLASAGAAFTDRGSFTTLWFKSALGNRTFQGQLLNSLLLATVVTLLTNLITFPLALIGQYFDFRGKLFWSSFVLAPMILPPFVGAVGLRRLLGTFGSLTVFLQHLGILYPTHGINWLTAGGFWALAGLMALGLYPIAYLNLQASLANIDPAMLEAARNLGGTRWGNFWKITLPLARPGVFAGSTLVFIWAFTELGTPLMIQYPNVVSRAIWDEVAGATEGRSSVGFAKVMIVLAIAATVYVVGKTTLGRAGYAMTSKAAVAATATRLRGTKALLASLPFAAITFLALLPHIGVVLYSFTAIAIEPASGWGREGEFGWYRTMIPDRYTLEGYRAVLNTPEIYTSILNSIRYAGMATLINLILGIAIAWVLVRWKMVWGGGRIALDSLAMLPLAVPGIVMAFGFIAVMMQMAGVDPAAWKITAGPLWLQNGITWMLQSIAAALRATGSHLKANPFWILVIAYSVRRLPYLVRSAAGGLEQTSITLEEAGANLGASPWRVMTKITLPLILGNLIAGGLLTFSFAMMEVSDSLILAQLPKHYPITKMINALGNDLGGPANVRNACALGVLAMLFMTAMIVGARLLMGKKMGAIFRA